MRQNFYTLVAALAITAGLFTSCVKDEPAQIVTAPAKLMSRGPLSIDGSGLYIAGAGSETGQEFKFIEDAAGNYYEIYTKITANQPYYFYSGASETEGSKYSIDAEGTGFVDITGTGSTGARVGTTGVYRIRLYPDTGDATIESIDKIVIRYSINSRDVALSYIGRGTWKVENYNLLLRKESWGTEVRYKFVFTVNGVAEHWGKHLNAPSATGADRTIKKVGTTQWNGVMDYPSALRDGNNLCRYYSDVVLHMNTRSEYYTHNFENWYDSETYYNGDRTFPSASTWAAIADSCTFTIVDQFLNQSRGTFWASSKNVLNDSQYFYWQQAYPIHTLAYSYARIKDSNPALAAQYETYFTRWYQNKGNNWYSSNSFYNEYTDDMAWISLALIHMYEVTGVEAYFNTAKDLYDNSMLESRRIKEDAEGWGLVWKLNSTARNACTNTPAGLLACKIYEITDNSKYLEDAKKFYNYMRDDAQKRVNNSGRVEEPPLTYTQGTWAELCRRLYHITNEDKYRNDATTALVYTMTSGRCTNSQGLLRDEGKSGDQSNFKGGLIPYMVTYANDTSMPAATRQQVKDFLTYNARMLWFHNMDKSLYPKTFAGFVWNQKYNVAGNPGSLGAHNSGAALLEGMTRLN